MLRTTLAGLRLHASRYVTTTLAILLGVMFISGTMVFADTLNASYEESVMGSATSVDAIAVGDLSQDQDGEGQDPQPFTEDQLDQVRELPEAAEVDGVGQSPTMLLDADGRTYGTLPPSAMTVGEVSRFAPSEGEMPDADDEIVLATVISDQTGFGIGDTVTLLDPEQDEHDFTVTGLIDLGLDPEFSYRGAVVLAPDAFEAMTGAQGYHEIDALAADNTSEEDLAAAMESVLGEGADVYTATAFGEGLADEVGTETEMIRAGLLMFALVAVFVAGIVIYNTFAILIAQRQRELALLRCLGAKRGQVFRSVLAESFVVGLIASVLGVLAGLGIGMAGIRFGGPLMGVDSISTVVVTPTAVFTGLLVGTLMTVFSTLVPAMRATRVAPLAALRTSATAAGLEKGTGWVRVVFGLLAFACSAGLVTLALAPEPSEENLYVVVGAALIAFVGVVVLGPLLVRGIVRLVGVPLRRVGVPSMLAVDNSTRSPRRAATAMIALTVGATLITGYSVASSSLQQTTAHELDSRYPADYEIRPMMNAEAFGDGEESGAQEGSEDQQDEEPVDLSTIPDSVRADLAESDEVEEVFAQRSDLVGTDEAVASVEGTAPVTAVYGTSTVDKIDGDVVGGEVSDLEQGRAIVTEGFADSVGVGDTIPLESPQGVLEVEVAAVVESTALFNGVIVDPQDFDQLRPDMSGDSAVMVRGTDGTAAAELRDAVYTAVDAHPTLMVISTIEERQEFENLLDTVFYSIAAMLGLAIIIALFGISNTMALSVLERTRESALLRAMGLKRSQLRRMLGVEAVVLCLIGAVIGVVLGVVFGWAVSASVMSDVLLALPAGQIATFIGLAVVAGVVASLLPARRAAGASITGALASE